MRMMQVEPGSLAARKLAEQENESGLTYSDMRREYERGVRDALRIVERGTKSFSGGPRLQDLIEELIEGENA